jgi:hypothetical protein
LILKADQAGGDGSTDIGYLRPHQADAGGIEAGIAGWLKEQVVVVAKTVLNGLR